MKGALDYASMGFIPAGAYRNREFAGGECEFSWKNHSGESSENFWLEKTRCEAVENETGRSETIINEAELAAREDIVFDPQTSGAVSYTHLDVYKRQVVVGVLFISDFKVKKPQNPMVILLVALVALALSMMFHLL